MSGKSNVSQAMQDNLSVGEAGSTDLSQADGAGLTGSEGASAGLAIEAGPTRRRFAASTVLLVASVVVAAGMLYGMRTMGLGASVASAKSTKFDQDLVKAAERKPRDHSAVIDDLNASRVSQQVPDDKVKRNPFRLDFATSAATAQNEGPDAAQVSERALREKAESERKALAARRAEVQKTLDGIRLQSVMYGPNPMARVNGRTVRVGDKINELFTVTEIRQRSVVVEAGEWAYELQMVPVLKNENP